MRGSETEVFEGKTLSGLLKDIYNISKDKRQEIKRLIVEYSEMILKPSDVIMVAPLIQQLLEVSVKNDDQLTKIATVVQRVISADAYQKNGGDPTEMLSEVEKEQLVRNAAKELIEAAKELQHESKTVTSPKLVKVK